MIDVSILIPIADNNKVAFTLEHFAVFETHVLAVAGGFSLLPQTVKGAWRNKAGIDMKDESRVYVVGIESLINGGLIGDIVTFAKVHFEQEAITIRYLGLLEIL